MKHEYSISGMTCNNCVGKVRSEILKIGDVTSAEIQLASPQAVITMQKHIPLDTLQKAVQNAGSKYSIAEIGQPMQMEKSMNDDEASNSYFPLFLIFAYITGTSLIIQVAQGQFNAMQWMSHFMAGFFLVFSFFKLMNLAGFAEGYRTYDIVAARIPAYGFIYPFIELALGVSFLTGFEPVLTNAITVLVMGISTIGVANSLWKRKPFQCACLGTIIKLPLSKVTLFEDILMLVMSAIMLFLLR
jgi:copper chaperone CopZ